jgi:hypothetical protein
MYHVQVICLSWMEGAVPEVMPSQTFRHYLYLILSLVMLAIALPRINVGQGWTWESVFGLVWVAFALLVITAHLHGLLKVNKETRRQLDRIRRAKAAVWQRKLQQRQGRPYSG